jgi:hypothetical protein
MNPPRRTPRLISLAALLPLALAAPVHSDDLPLVAGVELQPLAAQARRIAEALDYLGQPLSKAEQDKLAAAARAGDPDEGVRAIQAVLDPHCLVGVQINPESRVKSMPGPAAPELVQQGWRVFLVKVQNEAGVTAPLKVASPNAAPVYKQSTGSPRGTPAIPTEAIPERWCDARMFDDRPLTATLSGLPLEYRILQLYSRDAGRREAKLTFDVGQGTQDVGFRSDVDILFRCAPAVEVTLEVLDDDGRPTTASFLIRDPQGRVYPAQSRRLAPDFFFHPQVYRHSGESVHLPPGTYSVEFTRGPEYLVQTRTVHVPDAAAHRESFRLKRWIDLAKLHWFSGDHHVHAAGCAHYESPTEGVGPADMMRHILGEDLRVGCVLSWGPCWYFQKQFFEGKLHELSTPDYLMRYDVEVSGFPSSHAGHLCLLRLKEDDYPGTERIEDWPSWDLPVLKWGKEQGGVVGFSHSGWGLQTVAKDLPNLEMPRFDGIGANEYIVDVVHGVVDFISTVDTPAPYELNIWYHTLNCGFRCRISGETDFPCIYGERVGLGRVYVELPDGKLDYDRWAEGIKQGRSYVSDGFSHLIGFRVNDRVLGTEDSEVKLDKAGAVTVKVQAAARLDPQPSAEGRAIRARSVDQKPYWHVERARIEGTRKVPVEVIVNGRPVAREEIEADGSVHDLEFSVPIERSSWVAVRVLHSSHTNPIFVLVGDAPIRASRQSADWCARAVDQCWSQKEKAIRASERAEARAAFDDARAAYRKILAESDVD